ncbi:hypothetical protein [Alkaliphilus metalliredigens]|uniref:hypothetical protein n=1 Tax=Alkaliphilus metalliredigens TaxID=208226 RepID=UPI0003166E39|nr:hypothetical protein [Alkaliphilus metalliredigens]
MGFQYLKDNISIEKLKVDIKMGRKRLEVTSLHGFTMDELIALEEKHQKKS